MHHVLCHSQATLSDRAGATCWFADWRMAFVQVEPPEFYGLISQLEARTHHLNHPITHSHLRTLLAAFSEV